MFSFLRRQWRRSGFATWRTPVIFLMNWGIGRFCLIFFASVRFVRNDLCAAIDRPQPPHL